MPTDLAQLGFGPLLVLQLVGGQLVLTLCFRSLCGLPVALEPGPGLRLCLSSPCGGPTTLRLVLVRVRHADGVRELSRGECLDLLRPSQCVGPERRSPAPCRQQTLQRLDPCVEFLRASPGLRLALLPVGRSLLAVAARELSLVGALLPLLIPLVSGLRLTLTLLLALRFSPDTDQPIGATAHALQALPTRDSACVHQALAP